MEHFSALQSYQRVPGVKNLRNDPNQSELRYQIENFDFLNELLRTIPVLMKVVNERMHVKVNDKMLMESKAFLQSGWCY